MLNYNLLLNRQIKFSFEDLRLYAQHMEKFILESIDQFESDHDQKKYDELKESNPEYYYWIIDELAERWQQISKVYPNNFRSALFSQIYGTLETKLKRVCDLHREKHHTSIKVNERLSYIDQSKQYLKSIGIDLSNITYEFKTVDTLRLVRNQIIHDEGRITSNHPSWKRIHRLTKQGTLNFHFDHDLNEIQDDGSPLYKSRKNFKFQMVFGGPELNEYFLGTVGSIFDKLGQKPIF